MNLFIFQNIFKLLLAFENVYTSISDILYRNIVMNINEIFSELDQ